MTYEERIQILEAWDAFNVPDDERHQLPDYVIAAHDELMKEEMLGMTIPL